MLDDLAMIDPTLQLIDEKRKIGLWPPSGDNIADSLYPYIKRFKKASVNVLDVGVWLGETTFRLLELDTIRKIDRITGLTTPNEASFAKDTAIKNLKGTRTTVTNTLDPGVKFDVVMINCEIVSNVRGPDFQLDNTIRTYYNFLETGGIFCGNDHDKDYTKEALGKFRRTDKIGTPILIANRSTWFWIKR